ncbi:MAG: serine hydrolase [Solirubrobacterales bacterium]|nr:serine hydrolase [Solirubrobacterales bacterium]
MTVVAALACAIAFAAARPPTASAASVQTRINALIRDAIARHGIRAAIFQATKNGRTVMTKAYGYSQTGVPATTKMHFRNGAVAISYMSTLLLRLVDERKVKLDDKISKWLPNLRDSNRVTLRMLASMTAGYHDYEIDPALIPDRLYNNPFVTITTQFQLKLALDKPQQFPPGTNFSYAHSNYVILGLILSKITKLPLDVALSRMVLRPLGLKNTVASIKPPIPLLALHAYSGERAPFFNIPLKAHFFEDSTYWNPSWTLAHGAIETTDIVDMTRTAIGIGSGRLLSRSSYRAQTDPHIGFGHPAPKTCERCMKLNRYYGYGIGLVTNGNRGQWLLQNPLFAGEAAIESYLPSQRISIAIAMTFKPTAYDAQGNPSPYWQVLWAKIAKVLAPRNPPAVPPGLG